MELLGSQANTRGCATAHERLASENGKKSGESGQPSNRKSKFNIYFFVQVAGRLAGEEFWSADCLFGAPSGAWGNVMHE